MSRMLLIVGLVFSVVVHVVLMCWPAPAAAPSSPRAAPVVVPVIETELARLETPEPEPEPVTLAAPVEAPAPAPGPDPTPEPEPPATELASHESLAPLFDGQDGRAEAESPLVAEPQPIAEPRPVPEIAAAEPEPFVASAPPVERQPAPAAEPERPIETEPPTELVTEPLPSEPAAVAPQPPGRDPIVADERAEADPTGPIEALETPETPAASEAARSDPVGRDDDVATTPPPASSSSPREPAGTRRADTTRGRHQPVLRIDWGTVAHARATIDAGDMRMVVLAEGRDGPMIVGEIVEDSGRWRREAYQPAAGSMRYSNRLRVVDDVPAFQDVRRDSSLVAGEHLAVLVPVVLERRFESAQLEAAFSRGLTMQQIGNFGGRFDLQNGALQFTITQVGEGRP